jgi:hypothetical protein
LLATVSAPQVAQAQSFESDLWPFPAPIGRTGQVSCFDRGGNLIDCAGSGQDGEHTAGVPWPDPRFSVNGDGTVTDNLTGLIWLRDAGCLYGTWPEVLSAANNLADGTCGLSDGSAPGDWRLANVQELLSLTSNEHHDPALPDTSGTGQWSEGDPFVGVQQIYWSATHSNFEPWGLLLYNLVVDISNPGFFSRGINLLEYGWTVKAGEGVSSPPAPVRVTGQQSCVDAAGVIIACTGTGQDGELQAGTPWPSPRFSPRQNGTVVDNLTGLLWLRNPDCLGYGNWTTALAQVAALEDGMCALSDGSSPGDWRLPNFFELASLVHFGYTYPALPDTTGDGQHSYGNPFYANDFSRTWSSTSEAYFPSYVPLVDLDQGSTLTKSKAETTLAIWAVRDATIFIDGFESGDTSDWSSTAQ